MRALATLFCLFVFPLVATAKPTGGLVAVKGSVQLKAIDGSLLELRNGPASFSVDFVSMWRHPVKYFKSERVLQLMVGGQEVDFRIPKGRYLNGDFGVSADDNGQRVKLDSIVIKSHVQRQQYNSTVSCTYVTYVPMPTLSCDSKGICTTNISMQPQYNSGTQLAAIDGYTWIEKRRIKISSETGLSYIEGDAHEENNLSVVRELSGCG